MLKNKLLSFLNKSLTDTLDNSTNLNYGLAELISKNCNSAFVLGIKYPYVINDNKLFVNDMFIENPAEWRLSKGTTLKEKSKQYGEKITYEACVQSLDPSQKSCVLMILNNEAMFTENAYLLASISPKIKTIKAKKNDKVKVSGHYVYLFSRSKILKSFEITSLKKT